MTACHHCGADGANLRVDLNGYLGCWRCGWEDYGTPLARVHDTGENRRKAPPAADFQDRREWVEREQVSERAKEKAVEAQHLDKLGFSPQEIAKELGRSERQVSRYVNGRRAR